MSNKAEKVIEETTVVDESGKHLSVADIQPKKEVAVTDPNSASGLIAMAVNADLDIEKMKELIKMRDHEEEKTAKSLFNIAMARVQENIEPVIADAENQQTDSRYSRLTTVVSTLAPIYTKEGFSVSFGTGECTSQKLVDDWWFRTIAELSHVGGYTKTYHVDLPADIRGPKGTINKTLIHGTKSAITYARVILMGLMFNFTTTLDVDNDGNSQTETITDKQMIELQDHMDALDVDEKGFFKYLSIESLADMPAAYWPKAMNAIERKPKAAEK